MDGVGNRDRKGETSPITFRFQDNDLITLLKLIEKRWRLQAGKLPSMEQELLFYTAEGAQPKVRPSLVGRSQTLGHGVGVVLNFDERNDFVTPSLNNKYEPYPQRTMYGIQGNFPTPVYNTGAGQERFTTPFGASARVEQMGGNSHVYRVTSDDDYLEIAKNDVLLTLPDGTMSVWVQGYDDGSDGNRKYYILDSEKFQLYYEYDATTVPVMSRLVWKPNTDVATFNITLDIDATGVGGWFGYTPTRLRLFWDYGQQIFEMYYGEKRAAIEPPSFVEMPAIVGKRMSLGNSLRPPYYSGGNQNAYQQFDDWTFSKLKPGISSVSSVDGQVMQTLFPIHRGNFATACGDSATPINLGRSQEPFDELHVRKMFLYCPSGGSTPWMSSSTLDSSYDAGRVIDYSTGLGPYKGIFPSGGVKETFNVSFEVSNRWLQSLDNTANNIIDLIYHQINAALTGTQHYLYMATSIDNGSTINRDFDFVIGGTFISRSVIQAGDTSNVGNFIIYDGSGNKITIQTPALSSDWSLTLPVNDGNANDALVTNGSGVTSWKDINTLSHKDLAIPFSTLRSASGSFYAQGYYTFGLSSNDFNPPITFGTANAPYGAHVLFVSTNHPGANATTIRVSGTSITDTGTRTAADTEDVVIPTTAVSGDYFETSKKWIGQVTLSKTAGDDVACNYGFCKYFDNHNENFNIQGFDCTWVQNLNDTSLNIILRHHKSTGWTYNAGGGPTPPTPLAALQTDYNTEYQGKTGENHAWKRTNISTSVNGGGSEGIILEIVTGINQSVLIGSFAMHYKDE